MVFDLKAIIVKETKTSHKALKYIYNKTRHSNIYINILKENSIF